MKHFGFHFPMWCLKPLFWIFFFAKNIATIENKCASKHIGGFCNVKPRQVTWKSSPSHGGQLEVLWESIPLPFLCLLTPTFGLILSPWKCYFSVWALRVKIVQHFVYGRIRFSREVRCSNRNRNSAFKGDRLFTLVCREWQQYWENSVLSLPLCPWCKMSKDWPELLFVCSAVGLKIHASPLRMFYSVFVRAEFSFSEGQRKILVCYKKQLNKTWADRFFFFLQLSTCEEIQYF